MAFPVDCTDNVLVCSWWLFSNRLVKLVCVFLVGKRVYYLPVSVLHHYRMAPNDGKLFLKRLYFFNFADCLFGHGWLFNI